MEDQQQGESFFSEWFIKEIAAIPWWVFVAVLALGVLARFAPQ